MKLSLMFFENAQGVHTKPKKDTYQFFLDVAKFADKSGFHRLWLPERHFHPFGGNFASPVVLAAALATHTSNIRIGAGSVVLPLHHPVRVAEEWAMVDNLSGGRVDISFTKGWNKSENVFFPQHSNYSTTQLLQNIDLIQRLWKGETLAFDNGQDTSKNVTTYPRPYQSDIPVCISTFDPQLFETAAEKQYSVLTALLRQTPAELKEKIKRYDRAWAATHHTARGSKISLMLHTYVGSSIEEVHDTAKTPVRDYLKSSMHLWSQASDSLKELNESEREKILDFACRRYIRKSGLFESEASCLEKLKEYQAIGVDEIACLIDFGIDESYVMASLKRLARILPNLT